MVTDQTRQLRLRVAQDAVADGHAGQLERRATGLESAVGRPGDYLGRSTLLERAHRDAALHAAALALRRRATWIRANCQPPEQLTADERAVADAWAWMPRASLFDPETAPQLIARHRRVIAALTNTRRPLDGLGAA